MNQPMKRMFFISLMGLLLSSCAAGTGRYTPQIRDVTEEAVSDNYSYQKFTLYNPANSTTDCLITRTGQKLDLNSSAELAEVWSKNCRNANDTGTRSDR